MLPPLWSSAAMKPLAVADLLELLLVHRDAPDRARRSGDDRSNAAGPPRERQRTGSQASAELRHLDVAALERIVIDLDLGRRLQPAAVDLGQLLDQLGLEVLDVVLQPGRLVLGGLDAGAATPTSSRPARRPGRSGRAARRGTAARRAGRRGSTRPTTAGRRATGPPAGPGPPGPRRTPPRAGCAASWSWSRTCPAAWPARRRPARRPPCGSAARSPRRSRPAGRTA